MTPRLLPLVLALTVLLAGRYAWARSGEEEQTGNLDVATFNTWGLPFPIAWRPRERRFPSIQRWMDDGGLDLVGLQEVWGGARHLLDLRGLLFPKSRGDSGLALYTPHRVTRPAEVVPFPTARGFDRWKDKGVLVAGVDVPALGEVTVLVTHMQAGSGGRNAAVRAEQAAELLRILGETSGPTVVMGDFNLYGAEGLDQETERRMLAAGLRDAAEPGGDRGPTHQGEAERFDRVFFRGDGGTRVEPATSVVDRSVGHLSDHLPVLARLQWFRG